MPHRKCLLWLSIAAAPPALAAETAACSADAAAGADGRCRAVPDHVLLQVRAHSGVSAVAPGQFDRQEGSSCTDMPDVKTACSDNGCRVLAANMQGQTCHAWCQRSGRTCSAAWEAVDDSCNIKESLACDQSSSDAARSTLLCECSPKVDARSVSDAAATEAPTCTGLQHVEEVCSTNQCKVRADQMKDRTCAQYCGEHGLACLGAWEEVNEDCAVLETLACDQTFPGTTDLLCECAPKSATPALEAAPPVSGVGPGRATPDTGPAPPAAPTRAPSSELPLVWADEFSNWSIDRKKWNHVTGGGGFGNQELQHYTSRRKNAHTEHGILKIRAHCERYGGNEYTSAKLTTKNLADFGPGHRVEVRAKLPVGQGTWPAIWMLPTDNAYGGWPRSGEIDIMEAVGCTPSTVYGTVHTEAFNHMIHTEKFNVYQTQVSEWHTYSIDWDHSSIKWYIDDVHYHTFAPDNTRSDEWPFNRRFHLILNLAVGGTWGGYCASRPSCESASQFGRDQVMEVDYARVYSLKGYQGQSY